MATEYQAPAFVTYLTKREWFAGLAMQGLLSQHVKFNKIDRDAEDYDTEPAYKCGYINTDAELTIQSLATDAVQIADTLIAELNKVTSTEADLLVQQQLS